MYSILIHRSVDLQSSYRVRNVEASSLKALSQPARVPRGARDVNRDPFILEDEERERPQTATGTSLRKCVGYEITLAQVQVWQTNPRQWGAQCRRSPNTREALPAGEVACMQCIHAFARHDAV